MSPEKLPEHAERCPDCGSEDDLPDVHKRDCLRLGSVLQYGPPWLLIPGSRPRPEPQD